MPRADAITITREAAAAPLNKIRFFITPPLSVYFSVPIPKLRKLSCRTAIEPDLHLGQGVVGQLHGHVHLGLHGGRFPCLPLVLQMQRVSAAHGVTSSAAAMPAHQAAYGRRLAKGCPVAGLSGARNGRAPQRAPSRDR